jgi:AsmA protein
MKRPSLIAIGLGVAICIAAGLHPWQISADTMRRAARDMLPGGVALQDAAGTRFTFTALPLPRLEVIAPHFADATGTVDLRADALRGALRLLPLLGGQLELADVSLIRPRLTVVEAGREALQSRILASLAADDIASTLDLSRVVIVDGAIIRASDAGTREVLTSLNVILRKAHGQDAIDAVIGARWRGETIEATVLGFDPRRYGAAEVTPLVMSLSTRLASAQFDGRITRTAQGFVSQADGNLSFASPDLPGLATWLGTTVPVSAGMALKGHGEARFSTSGLSLNGARFTLDDQSFDGVVTLRLGDDGRLGVAGTLATDQFDVTQAMRAIVPARASDGGWSREPLDLGWVPRGDVDLRLSVGKLGIRNATITNAALAVIGRHGRADVTLGAAEFHRGTVKGRLGVVANSRGGLDARGHITFDRIDTTALLTNLGGGRRVAGLASGSASIESTGDSPAAMMRNLDGRITLALRQGEIVGVNLPEVLRRMEKRSLLAALDVRGGRTPFEFATISGRITRGLLELSEGSMTSSATRVQFGGQVNLADRTVAITGLAQGPESAAKDSPVLPFEVTGTFDDPAVMPDARSIIQRSGAAAPLLAPRTAAQQRQDPPLLIDGYAPSPAR